MLEKLCLKWNDFQNNINTAVESLRENSDFADVTLVSEDGQQVAAHKVNLTNTNRNTNTKTNTNTNTNAKTNTNTNAKRSKRRGGPVNTPTARRLFPESRWEPLSLPSASNLNFQERLFPFLPPEERNTVDSLARNQLITTQPLCFKSEFPWKIISISSPPCFTSHFLFLPDPWYLLRCRWMVGNSDGSVIETYSPHPAAVGDNNKISISANFHRDRCLCRPNGPPGVRISDMKYSSRPQI